MIAVIVGIIVGTLFWQTDQSLSILSVLFQSMFYACISQMTSISKQFPERSIFYKHQDANFFPTWCYVLGKSVASFPIAITDAIGYGTLIYLCVGLAINDGAGVGNFFMFLLIVFATSLTTGLFFMIYSASLRVVTVAQAAMAITAVIFVVFSGFTVQPNVIPPYYIWVYWLNFFAWSLRGIVVNEFQSGKYDTITETGLTEGEQTLKQFGFIDSSGEPFEWIWAVWGFLVVAGWACFSVITTVTCLKRIRFTTGGSLVTDKGTDEQEALDPNIAEVAIPFTRVDLTFTNIHYTVVSSITNEQLHLLNGIDGFVEAGKMTALMGSSGVCFLGFAFCFCSFSNPPLW
jgi:ABC-2 type transporter